MGDCRQSAGLGRGKKEGSKYLQRFLSRRKGTETCVAGLSVEQSPH